MKTIISACIALLLSVPIFSQDVDQVKIFIQEGTALHDKGDYAGAVAKYDQALELDKENVDALYEKSYALLLLKEYDASIEICEKLIQGDTDSTTLKLTYTSYANALDAAGKPAKAVEAYNAGIKLFPDYYHLYFNKGITLSKLQKYEAALISFEKAAALNPQHTSTHNAIARIQITVNNNIPSLLAFCRFSILEPQGGRAAANFPYIQKIMGAGVEKTGKKDVSITLDKNQLSDLDSKKKKENDFGAVYMILSLTAAMDFDKKNKKKSERELFLNKFESVCSVMEETREKNSGFYWEYYAPYFIEMHKKNWLETFSYIVYANSDDDSVISWLKKNQEKIEAFYKWSSDYVWNIK